MSPQSEIAAVMSGERQWCVIHAPWQFVLPNLAPGCVDHVITDPPYSEHTHSKQWIGAALTNKGAKRVSTAHTGLGFDSLDDESRVGLLSESERLSKRWILVFSDIESAHLIRHERLDYVRTCIWDKVDSAPQFSGDRPAASAEAIVALAHGGKKRWNGGGLRGVFRFPVNGDRGPKPHPSTKPQALMLELVGMFTDTTEIILDPYCGSGSTGMAAVRLGRRFIGIEQNARWVEVARERISSASPSRISRYMKQTTMDWENV